MFGQKKQTIHPDSTDTLIGRGSSFEGTVKSEAGIRIEGNIKGQIQSVGDVVIGDEGEALSDISARNITIAGIVRGDLAISGKCTITSKGQLFGNCTAHALVIEEGGRFDGTSKMQSSEQETAKQKASAAKEKSTN
jgi:cytoskeletal protein CcmA (bactofilin family)